MKYIVKIEGHEYLCPWTVYHGENKLIFNEMMMRSALYQNQHD